MTIRERHAVRQQYRRLRGCIVRLSAQGLIKPAAALSQIAALDLKINV